MDRTGKYPRLITMAASAVVIAALYLTRGVLVPFALAMLVSFLLAPLVLRLQRWRFNRIVAVLTVMLLVLAASGAASWLVAGQLRDVTSRLPEYRHNIQDKMATLRGVLAKPFQATTKIVEDLSSDLAPGFVPDAGAAPIQTVRVAEPPRGTFEILRDLVGPTLEILVKVAMTLLFAFVMLLRRDDLGDRLIRIVGQGSILVTTRALEEAGRKVSSFLWRLLLVNGLHGLVIGVGLAFIGVPNALLWGALAALLRFIPYVGLWIAATCAVLTSLAVSPGWSQPLLTVGWFAIVELISNNFVEPWVYGAGTGVSPLAILVSALFWTWLWGPVGLMLSTPLTVCLIVMGKYVPQLQFLHLLFGDAPGLSPPARLYQRLIAGDQDQAWLVLRTEIEKKSLHELYDSVVLPALSMAEHDRQRGSLDEDAEARMEETIRLLLEEAGDLRVGADAGAESSPVPVFENSLRVLCLPARGSADALAASMLRQVLERDGVQVEVASIDELSGETLDLLERRRVDVVCISAVPPSGFMHVRYLCKRIAGRFPKLPVVVGLWTQELENQTLADRFPILAGVHVVASLGAARTQVQQLAASARIQRDAVPVPVAAAVASA
jgi:predicted PurR-regulated permease PerM